MLDVSGRWDITVVNTITTGACDGEQGDTSLHQASFEQSGSVLVVTGFGGSSANKWDGMVVGTTITFNGTRPEDGGTTTTSFTLEVDIDAGTLAGAEAWTWVGPGGSCPGNASTVTGFRAG